MSHFRKLILAVLAFGVIAASQSWAGLSVYYDFEAIDNGYILDKSGNGINGEIVGDVTLDDGQLGKAGRFANQGYLDLDGPNVPPALIPTKGFSLLAWVKIETLEGQHAIFNAKSAGGIWLIHPEVRPGNNDYRFTLRTDAKESIANINAGTPELEKWHHWAGTYSADTSTAILYIDGVEVGRYADGPVGGTIAGDWGAGARIGYNIDDNRPFTGQMDEVAIWTEALTQAKIKEYMTDGVLAKTAVEAQHKLATTWANIKNR